jgi:hypothetical protein
MSLRVELSFEASLKFGASRGSQFAGSLRRNLNFVAHLVQLLSLNGGMLSLHVVLNNLRSIGTLIVMILGLQPQGG